MPSPVSQISSIAGQQPSSATPIDVSQQSFGSQYLDQGNPSLFDFNLAEMNFGNHYGALEFGMLGHMSSGAQGNPLGSTQNSTMTPPAFEPPNYDRSRYIRFDQNDLSPFKESDQTNTWQSSPTQQEIPFRAPDAGVNERFPSRPHQGPLAFAIASGSSHLQGVSPVSSSPDMAAPYDGVVRDSTGGPNQRQPALQRSCSAPQTFDHQQQSPQRARGNLLQQQHHQRQQDRRRPQTPTERSSRHATPSEKISRQLQFMASAPSHARRLRRDPSVIYSSVTQPYPYTAAFHALLDLIWKRFSPKKRNRIAKALGSIRPSLISFNQWLTEADLVFMEKCFQRGLWDYEDYANACGTPTIVCRRTGEVAHVGKEFTILAGWTKEVLLGKDPNLNVNFGQTFNGPQLGSGTATANSARGRFNTPRSNQDNGIKVEDEAETQQATSSPRQQPVFLAELMDEDSVVRFYEDYAKLAFADSKGSAWAPCKVLRYEPEENVDAKCPSKNGSGTGTDSDTDSKTKDRALDQVNGKKIDSIISPAESLQNLGTKDGKISCMYCWFVKRDVFNIPMMIVINVSGAFPIFVVLALRRH